MSDKSWILLVSLLVFDSSCAFQLYGPSVQLPKFAHLPLQSRSLSKVAKSNSDISRHKFSVRLSQLVRLQAADAAERKSDESAGEVVAESKPSQNDPMPSTYAWFVAILLLALNIHNQWTRALVYYLVSFKAPDGTESSRLYMNKDLDFGEEQYALLASFGFTALFTTFSLLAGRVADKFNRAQVIAAAAGVWSLANAAQASASSFQGILDLRALTGMSQAFLNPQVSTLHHSLPRTSSNHYFASPKTIDGAQCSSFAQRMLSYARKPAAAAAAAAAAHPSAHTAAAAAAAAVAAAAARRTVCCRPTSPPRCRPR